MMITDSLYEKMVDYLGKPLSSEEFAGLNLKPSTIARLNTLLSLREQRALTICEKAELEAFRQAAFYLRMGQKAN